MPMSMFRHQKTIYLNSGTWDSFKLNAIGYCSSHSGYFSRFGPVTSGNLLAQSGAWSSVHDLVPFLALVPAVILAHTLLGPIGWQLVGFHRLFGAGFSSGSWCCLCFYLHWLLPSPSWLNAIDSELIANFNGTGLWPMIALSNIACSAVLAVWWLTLQGWEQNRITVPSVISIIVTEPALFGVNLKYSYPFLAGMIGSSWRASDCDNLDKVTS